MPFADCIIGFIQDDYTCSESHFQYVIRLVYVFLYLIFGYDSDRSVWNCSVRDCSDAGLHKPASVMIFTRECGIGVHYYSGSWYNHIIMSWPKGFVPDSDNGGRFLQIPHVRFV